MSESRYLRQAAIEFVWYFEVLECITTYGSFSLDLGFGKAVTYE